MRATFIAGISFDGVPPPSRDDNDSDNSYYGYTISGNGVEPT